MVGCLWLCWLPEESFEEDRPKRKKKTSQQKFKERYEAGDPEVDLLGEPSGRFDYYVLYPKSKKQTFPSPSKKDYNQNQKPPLVPYYQKALLQTLKCQPLPTKPTQIPESSLCYMFDQASPSYSQNFPPLENFDHPQTNTKHVWKIKNPVGTNSDGTKKQKQNYCSSEVLHINKGPTVSSNSYSWEK